MGYYGRLEDKLLAQKLRQKGYSYNEILKRIHVSKDTLSRWCKDIKLTVKQKRRLLQNKILGQRKGSLVAAENKRKSRLKRTNEIYKESIRQLGKLSKRDIFIAGIALYAAEGDKTDGHGGFSNADPKLIKFMMNWFRNYCKISNDKFRGAIWLHEDNSEVKAKKFWSDVTSIPMNQFYKTYIARNKKDSNKIRKKRHNYGIFAIKFSQTETHRKIMGWIFALLDGKIPDVH